MADIYHQVGVNASVNKVFQILTTLNGLSHWWTNTTGDVTLGSQLLFHFGEHKVEITIEELLADKKVVWRCF